ncbi:conserved protein of unknown function [Denitratisoma oestradiolicum]|uniref:Uncharacterized protein n=1 Tax=Denitratisoma oestradiolicum TaxID=311182 RepID=A0A6S6XYY5_9PROT|nr:conserved protein of unknown function [Denitratisoma oestradiolicum]
MRGTHPKVETQEGHHRFIPAHAGNTTSNSLSLLQQSVHPRACGEHYLSRGSHPNLAGSSPRMRGTLVRPRNS